MEEIREEDYVEPDDSAPVTTTTTTTTVTNDSDELQRRKERFNFMLWAGTIGGAIFGFLAGWWLYDLAAPHGFVPFTIINAIVTFLMLGGFTFAVMSAILVVALVHGLVGNASKGLVGGNPPPRYRRWFYYLLWAWIASLCLVVALTSHHTSASNEFSSEAETATTTAPVQGPPAPTTTTPAVVPVAPECVGVRFNVNQNGRLLDYALSGTAQQRVNQALLHNGKADPRVIQAFYNSLGYQRAAPVKDWHTLVNADNSCLSDAGQTHLAWIRSELTQRQYDFVSAPKYGWRWLVASAAGSNAIKQKGWVLSTSQDVQLKATMDGYTVWMLPAGNPVVWAQPPAVETQSEPAPSASTTPSTTTEAAPVAPPARTVTVAPAAPAAPPTTTVPAEPVNHRPTVEIVSVPAAVTVGGQVQICAQASDPDGDVLTFSWSALTGSLMPSGTCTLYVGMVPGGDTVTVTVSDGSTASKPAHANFQVVEDGF